jgi:hypothetical protein
MAIKKSSGSGIPSGNNAGRPANPGLGQLYSNGEAARLELYTQASGWQNIVQETPGVSSITGSYLESTNSGTITISGTNFVSGCYATAIGTNGVQVDATSTTFNSLVQVTATFTGLSNTHEPYDIKVTNPSNLFGMLPDALYINANPVWQTPSGTLGTFTEQFSISVSATATDETTVTYALASGSSLPSGVTLNSSTGEISGTPPDIATNTTYTFTINATDGANTVPRTFSITSVALSFDYLIVAGGGGGGVWVGSGGGAGGLLAGTLALTSKSIPITVGTGGIGTQDNGGAGAGPYVSAEKGGDSILSSLTAFGGGVGGSYGNSLAASQSNGGSGGGAMQQTGSQFSQSGSPVNYAGGTGVSGQGHAGGYYIEAAGPSGSQYVGAGGGGAGSAGAWANVTSSAVYSSTERKGGDGLANSITGTSIVYAGGGGGGANSWNGPVPSTAGLQVSNGGTGGGGAGWTFTQSPGNTSGASIDRYNTATNGTNGLGGGGGGVGWSGPGGKHRAGNGGSGVVIIAYPNTFPAITTIPGTLTYDQPTRAGYRVYRFTAGSGTITF